MTLKIFALERDNQGAILGSGGKFAYNLGAGYISL